MHDHSAITTFLFTDIEGSAELWEREPARMESALACHDALARRAAEANRGRVVKTTGDGMCAAFDDPKDALVAALDFQQSLADASATGGVPLKVRCGLHAGVAEKRDNDFFGAVLNRAARIMGAAHGGQVLASQALAVLVADRLPAGVTLDDLGAVRLRDLASAERVYQVVHPALRRAFPALRSLSSTPNNLPQQMTSFIGREEELAEVRRALAKARIVTLLGVGGMGKTRLSLQTAAEVMDDYPDGVWLVELAAVADPRMVPQAIASALGVKEESGHSIAEALTAALRDRRLLLIVDNCEHLLQACADVVSVLLRTVPQMKVLATSREPLRVAGEFVYALPALAVPVRANAIGAAAVGEFPAIRLFADRASAVQPDFRITDQSAAHVVEICHRLDGIPLAIELAAARVRALSVENIAERLDDRFRVLTGGDRTALPRQQTLRALIDWSYDLLTPDEGILFRRIAVFAGSFSLEAAEAVGAASAIEVPDVLDLLSRLVEKSLVALDLESARYRMLETVRQYAHERLVESGEGDDARARHLAFYLALAERARPSLVGPDQGAWLARLDFERENLLAAHASCDRLPDAAEAGLRLVYAIKPYWFNRGLLGLAYSVTTEALGRAGADARGRARCGGLADAGQIGFFLGRYSEARTLLQESLAIARELGDPKLIEAVLQPLGMACLGCGDVASARAHLTEALALARELGNKRELAAALNALGQLHRMQGELDAAEPFYRDVVALARELDNRDIMAIGLLNVAMVSIGRGATGPARGMLLEVLAIAGAIGSKPAEQSVFEVTAGLAAACRDWDAAARFYGIAEAQARNTGLHRDPTDEAFLAPYVAQAREALGNVAFVEAESVGASQSYERAIADVRGWLERLRT